MYDINMEHGGVEEWTGKLDDTPVRKRGGKQLRLFRAQRDCRINLRCTPRWNPAGNARHAHHQRDHPEIRDGIRAVILPKSGVMSAPARRAAAPLSLIATPSAVSVIPWRNTGNLPNGPMTLVKCRKHCIRRLAQWHATCPAIKRYSRFGTFMKIISEVCTLRTVAGNVGKIAERVAAILAAYFGQPPAGRLLLERPASRPLPTCPFDLQAFAVSGRVWPSWQAAWSAFAIFPFGTQPPSVICAGRCCQ